MGHFYRFSILFAAYFWASALFASPIEFDQLINEGQSQQRAVANEVQQQSGVITWSSKKPTDLPLGENASSDSTVIISGDQGFKIKLKNTEKAKKKKRKLKTSSSPTNQ